MYPLNIALAAIVVFTLVVSALTLVVGEWFFGQALFVALLASGIFTLAVLPSFWHGLALKIQHARCRWSF